MVVVYRRQCQDQLDQFYIPLAILSDIEVSSITIFITCRGLSFRESKKMASAFLVGLGLATSAFLVSERVSAAIDCVNY